MSGRWQEVQRFFWYDSYLKRTHLTIFILFSSSPSIFVVLLKYSIVFDLCLYFCLSSFLNYPIITVVVLKVPIDYGKLSILIFNLNLSILFNCLSLILAQHSLERFYFVIIATRLIFTKKLLSKLISVIFLLQRHLLLIQIKAYLR